VEIAASTGFAGTAASTVPKSSAPSRKMVEGGAVLAGAVLAGGGCLIIPKGSISEERLKGGHSVVTRALSPALVV
jgi:hypothetical protein